jgi:hypothetical protein
MAMSWHHDRTEAKLPAISDQEIHEHPSSIFLKMTGRLICRRTGTRGGGTQKGGERRIVAVEEREGKGERGGGDWQSPPALPSLLQLLLPSPDILPHICCRIANPRCVFPRVCPGGWQGFPVGAALLCASYPVSHTILPYPTVVSSVRYTSSTPLLFIGRLISLMWLE